MTSLRKSSEMLSELNLEDDPFLFKQTKYHAHWYQSNGEHMKVENWNDPKQNVMMLKVGSSDIESGEVWLILINQSKMTFL